MSNNRKTTWIIWLTKRYIGIYSYAPAPKMKIKYSTIQDPTKWELAPSEKRAMNKIIKAWKNARRSR